MCKISIIIPVYNVEQYLRKCLDSCINQTFKDIEIIVVNDCSPDNSDVIMREYEEKYPDMIRCIYLEKNIRQGGARNRGLEIAQGEYIMFVDSDDWIAENMCEELYNSAKQNDADLVVCDWYRVFDAHASHKTAFVLPMSEKTNINKSCLFDNGIDVGPCSKLFKKSIIEKSKCLFPENMFYEDLAVTMVWYLSASVINYVNKPLYNYLYNENSVTNWDEDVSRKKYHINAIIYLIKNFKKANLQNKYNFLMGQFILTELYTFFSQFIFLNSEYLSEIDELIEFIKATIIDWKSCLNENKMMTEIEKHTVYQIMTVEKFFYKLKNENSLMQQCISLDNKVAIWGNGVWGRRVIKHLMLKQVIPSCVIDSDASLYGTYTSEGIPIVSFDEAKDKCDIVIIAIKNDNVYKELEKQIHQCNPEFTVRHFKEFFVLD